MRRFSSPLLASALFAVSVLGADPPAAPKIVGQTKVAPYKIVRLTLEGLPTKDADGNTVKPWQLWKVRPADPKNVPDWATGKNVQKPEWVGPPGNYLVEATWGYTLKNGDQFVNYDEVTLTILPPGPTPGPIPPGPVPPDPVPPGPVPPGPTPGPAPIPLPGLRVLIVEESDVNSRNALTPGQREVLFGQTVRDYLRTKCVTNAQNPDGAWRILDQHMNPTLTGDPDGQVWADALKRPRTSVPWLVISNGTAGYEGPLPADFNATKFIELVGRYAQ